MFWLWVKRERETMRKREWSEEREIAMRNCYIVKFPSPIKEIEKESQMNKKLNYVRFEMKNKKRDVRWVVKYVFFYLYFKPGYECSNNLVIILKN